MRYASMRNFDITNGEGVGVALFVQGCAFHCKDCFNSSTWDFNGGKEYTRDTEEMFLTYVSPDYIQRVTILGGEPMHPANRESVLALCKRIRKEYPDKKIWVYTGYLYEYLISESDLSDIDYLIDGQFVAELADYRLPFRGSSNQRIIDVQKSIVNNKVVLWGDTDEKGG